MAILTKDHERNPGATVLGGNILTRVNRCIALLGLVFGTASFPGAEITMSEYQVKALFLLNFARYVEWPAVAPGEKNDIVIGVLGDGKLGEMAGFVKGKSVDGRPVSMRQVQTPEEYEKCHMLFFVASEKARFSEILAGIKTKPVLTVGESDRFLDQGGVINFVKKDERIRLEINLTAARNAKLKISSKLLNVADRVTGKAP